MNEAIFYFFYDFANQSPALDKTIVFMAEEFPQIVVLLAGAFLLFHHEVFKKGSAFKTLKQKYKEIILVFLSGAIAWTLAHIVKYFIQTPRPFETLEGVASLFGKTGYSFPSGHSAFFMAVAFAIFFTHKKAGYVFGILAFIIGFARVSAGVHYPVDILGGFVLGAVVAFVSRTIYDRFASKEIKI